MKQVKLSFLLSFHLSALHLEKNTVVREFLCFLSSSFDGNIIHLKTTHTKKEFEEETKRRRSQTSFVRSPNRRRSDETSKLAQPVGH